MIREKSYFIEQLNFELFNYDCTLFEVLPIRMKDEKQILHFRREYWTKNISRKLRTSENEFGRTMEFENCAQRFIDFLFIKAKESIEFDGVIANLRFYSLVNLN